MGVTKPRFRPQLCAELTDTQLEATITNDTYAFSEKYDGSRLIVATGQRVNCYGRNGQTRNVHPLIEEAFGPIKTGWVFDGELLDDSYRIFDILATTRGDVRSSPWSARQEILVALSQKFHPQVRLVAQHFGTDAKRAFLDEARAARAEGIVAASTFSPYRSGKHFGMMKYKFVKQVDCHVIDKAVDGRDNLVLAMYDPEGNRVEVGKVSALVGDGPNVRVGDVVQVNVLYATRAGRLYQCTKPVIRSDKSAEECTLDQLDAITQP